MSTLLHPTLLEWLAHFDKECQEKKDSPTHIYNNLVMLGVEKPNSHIPAPRSGKLVGCDCVEIINDAKKKLEELPELRKLLIGRDKLLAERADSYNRDIALYTSLHTHHATFNYRAWCSLRDNNLLGAVRAVCLRDLRGPVKTYEKDPAQIVDGEIVYCRIALKSYGEALKTFLSNAPEGWF